MSPIWTLIPHGSLSHIANHCIQFKSIHVILVIRLRPFSLSSFLHLALTLSFVCAIEVGCHTLPLHAQNLGSVDLNVFHSS